MRYHYNAQATIEILQGLADRWFKDADNAREDGLAVLASTYEEKGYLIEDTIKEVKEEYEL
jgi:hypothetical protein